MRKKISKIAQTTVAALMLMCVITGIILMMCEVPATENQTAVTLMGLVLFCIGTIPGACISLLASRKETKRNGTY